MGSNLSSRSGLARIPRSLVNGIRLLRRTHDAEETRLRRAETLRGRVEMLLAMSLEECEWSEIEAARDHAGISEEMYKNFLCGLEEAHLSDLQAFCTSVGISYDNLFQDAKHFVPDDPRECEKMLADALKNGT